MDQRILGNLINFSGQNVFDVAFLHQVIGLLHGIGPRNREFIVQGRYFFKKMGCLIDGHKQKPRGARNFHRLVKDRQRVRVIAPKIAIERKENEHRTYNKGK